MSVNQEDSVKPVITSASEISTQENTSGLPYSSKYSRYTEYSDPNFSTIDANKNITMDQSQINLTQEENSQYIPFKMFRRYDNIDQLNMTLLMHAVTPGGSDVYVTSSII